MTDLIHDTPLSIILDPSDFFGDDHQRDLLACPECFHEYTRLDRTVVYQRGEDEPTTIMNIDAVEGWHVHGLEDNPSPRRDAVVLHFEGECGHRFTVTFIQHKGQTYTWVTTVEGSSDE